MRWTAVALLVWVVFNMPAQADETAMAIGDAGRGERLFLQKCGSCHQVGENAEQDAEEGTART